MYDAPLAQLFAYHGRMLSDRTRVEAYRGALARRVRPGDVVVDLGSGTGVLALLACQAGARKVYAIERGRIAELAKRLVAENGYADRIEIVAGESTHTTLPERANVLVTETLWNFGLGEGLLDAVADARARLLTSDAQLIPRHLEMFAAPVELVSMFDRFDVWNEQRLGLNLAAARAAVLGTVYPVAAELDSLLAPGALVASIDLEGSIDAGGGVGGDVRFTVERTGVVHGLLGWFRAELAPDIHLDNRPSRPGSSWNQALLPVDPPLPVAPGDELDTRIDAVADGSIWHWRVNQSRDGDVLAHRKHSTLEGFARFGGGRRPRPC